MKPIPFKPRKAWAIVWSKTGDILPADRSQQPDIFWTHAQAQESIDLGWADTDVRIQRILIVPRERKK